MLFLSPHPGYLITGCRQPVDNYHPASGAYLGTTPGIDIEFVHGGSPEWATEQALANPKFTSLWRGLPDNTDNRLFIATYDTEKKQQENSWDDETREEVERFLLGHPDFGTRYILMEHPENVQGEPWRGYDNAHHFTVIKVAKELDSDAQAYALDYERSHKNREVVVKALEDLVGETIVAA